MSQSNLGKNEKSREQILMEREAKKKAKQNSKKTLTKDESDKKTDQVTQPVVSSSTINKTNDDQNKDSSEKSKAQLRAERRALQEAQRAKKLELKDNKENEKKLPAEKVVVKQAAVEEKPQKPFVASIGTSHRVKLFAHLYGKSLDLKSWVLPPNGHVHPIVAQLGVQYKTRVVCGSNARCLALLHALKTVIQEYRTPANTDFSRGLQSELSRCLLFLGECRPISVSMSNAAKHLKFQLGHLHADIEADAKDELINWIDTYVKEQLEKAAEAISIFGINKIANGDVILIYSFSSLVLRILTTAHKKGLKFRVIVVDGKPWLEGREMLRRLLKAGLQCTYIFVNAISFVMPEVTKILLGAHALLANGYVMSRAGASQIALLGKTWYVPVLVCCETHKFCERVQTDSFVHNELGDPNDVMDGDSSVIANWKDMPFLTPLNLAYDVTPPDLVTAVVTELAILPCTSAPVILRIKPPELCS